MQIVHSPSFNPMLLEENTDFLLAICFQKSTSKKYKFALRLIEQAAHQTAHIDDTTYHIGFFKPTKNDLLLAWTLIGIVENCVIM